MTAAGNIDALESSSSTPYFWNKILKVLKYLTQVIRNHFIFKTKIEILGGLARY